MKNLAIILIFMFATNYIHAQNLVPNPSFEDTVYCPTTNNDIEAVVNWFNFGNSPDYFNACAPSGISVPIAYTGYQYANSGVAMTGVVTQMTNAAPSGANSREYIGAQLISPLIISQKYYFSFFINYSGYLNGFEQIAANKIGMKFSTLSYSEFSPPTTDNFAHLYTDSILTDTVGWYRISGSFIADSSYQYVILGNFFDSINTDTLNLGGTPFGSAGAYYYIDDVCVSVDSIYNYNWTISISENTLKKDIKIYPNPASNFVIIEGFNNLEVKFFITNSLGQIIKKETKKSYRNKLKINLLGLGKGIYYIRFDNQDIKPKKLLIKIKNP